MKPPSTKRPIPQSGTQKQTPEKVQASILKRFSRDRGVVRVTCCVKQWAENYTKLADFH